jgi:hypothetical protein
VSAPRVSIVIPVYNLRDFVAEAIESALAQSLPPGELEVIVIDDGSTDGSSDIARRYQSRIRYLRQENGGLSAARNTGIRASTAPFLAFLDADDRLHPDKLRAGLEVFDAHPATGLVYSGFHYIDEKGRPLPQRGWSHAEGDVFAELVLGNLIHPHQALVRREPVESARGFDERLTSAEDWDLWLRVSRRGVLWACVDRPLADYRIRPGSMHQNPTRMAENRVAVLEKVFADPELPAAVVQLRGPAFERAYLVSAAEHYRAGNHAAGAHWLGMAVRARPRVLADPKALTLFCQSLLPLGRQGGATMAREWRRLAATLGAAMDHVRGIPDPETHGARLRWSARLAYWRTVAPLLRRRAKDLFGLTRRRAEDPQRREAVARKGAQSPEEP